MAISLGRAVPRLGPTEIAVMENRAIAKELMLDRRPLPLLD
jgi:hypothetical protein